MPFENTELHYKKYDKFSKCNNEDELRKSCLDYLKHRCLFHVIKKIGFYLLVTLLIIAVNSWSKNNLDNPQIILIISIFVMIFVIIFTLVYLFRLNYIVTPKRMQAYKLLEKTHLFKTFHDEVVKKYPPKNVDVFTQSFHFKRENSYVLLYQIIQNDMISNNQSNYLGSFDTETKNQNSAHEQELKKSCLEYIKKRKSAKVIKCLTILAFFVISFICTFKASVFYDNKSLEFSAALIGMIGAYFLSFAVLTLWSVIFPKQGAAYRFLNSHMLFKEFYEEVVVNDHEMKGSVKTSSFEVRQYLTGLNIKIMYNNLQESEVLDKVQNYKNKANDESSFWGDFRSYAFFVLWIVLAVITIFSQIEFEIKCIIIICLLCFCTLSVNSILDIPYKKNPVKLQLSNIKVGVTKKKKSPVRYYIRGSLGGETTYRFGDVNVEIYIYFRDGNKDNDIYNIEYLPHSNVIVGYEVVK